MGFSVAGMVDLLELSGFLLKNCLFYLVLMKIVTR